MTNYERVAKLLAEINARSKETKNNSTSKQLTGKIGTDVTYQGKRASGVNPQDKTSYEYTYEEFELASQGQPLATIGRKNGFINSDQRRKPIPTNTVWVISPRYEDNGIESKTIEAVNQLHVYHAPDETADSVIDEICDTVAYSKAKAAADKKYSKLNIATRLADLGREM